jgi:hypothetical protein
VLSEGVTAIGNNAAKNQKNLVNQQAGTLFGESQSLLPQEEAGWQSVMNPLSSTDQAAIRNAGEGSVASSYGGSMDSARNTAAASGNSGGLMDLQDALATNKASTLGNQSLEDQANIDQQNLQRKEAGVGGLSGLGSTLQGGAQSLYGAGTQAADAQQASSFNWGNFLDSLVGGAATAGAAAIKSCWVAAAIFDGWDDPRTYLVRNWIFNVWANESAIGLLVSRLYTKFGKRISRSKLAVRMLKPLFILALKKAQE